MSLFNCTTLPLHINEGMVFFHDKVGEFRLYAQVHCNLIETGFNL